MAASLLQLNNALSYSTKRTKSSLATLLSFPLVPFFVVSDQHILVIPWSWGAYNIADAFTVIDFILRKTNISVETQWHRTHPIFTGHKTFYDHNVCKSTPHIHWGIEVKISSGKDYNTVLGKELGRFCTEIDNYDLYLRRDNTFKEGWMDHH